MSRRIASLCLGALLAASPVRAQTAPRPARPAPAWRFHLTGSLGFVRRQDEPWISIHEALLPAGWDYFYPTFPCFVDCRELASQVAEGHPVAGTVALRMKLRGIVQLRGFAGTAPFGKYPGQYSATSLSVTPAARAAGLQAGVTWRKLFLVAGPAVTMGRVVEQAGPTRRERRLTSAGVSVALGLEFPSRGAFYGELSVERRLAGAVRLDSISVAGAPAVPPMRIRFSHTMLQLGLGRRW